MSDNPSPYPPPNKKQKKKQPAKKTTRSPQLPTRSPTVRKTTPSNRKMTSLKKTPLQPTKIKISQEDHLPATPVARKPSPTSFKTPRMTPRRSEKMTPKRNEQKPGKINFNLGRQTAEDEEDDPIGKVIKAKMQIEERIRKEKRDRMLEELRKPIILTPGSKRGRREEGEWEQPSADAGTSTSCQAGALNPKMKQKPIQSRDVLPVLNASPANERKIHWTCDQI